MTAVVSRVGPGTGWSWRSGPCAALEHRFELRIEPRLDFAVAFEPLVAPLRASAAAAPSGSYEIRADPQTGAAPYTLTFDGDRVASGNRGTDLTGIFAWHVNHTVIERSVSRYVLLHAAAAVQDGVTVILPADQESGKTTTVAGLLRAGFDYVTDEAVALDPGTGGLAPFPKALSLDPGSWPLFEECRPPHGPAWARQWQVPAHRLGARALTAPAPPPRVVVFPRYVAGAATTVTPVSRGQAVHELARMTFEFPRDPARNLAALGRVARGARAVRLVIGQLDDAVAAIGELVRDRTLEEM